MFNFRTKNQQNLNGVGQKETVFHDALRGYLRDDSCGGKVRREISCPQVLQNLKNAMVRKLNSNPGTEKTGFDGIKRNLNTESARSSDAFLVRLEGPPRTSRFSFKVRPVDEQWVERSREEVNLHILLQSQFRAMKRGSPNRGDSLTAQEVYRYSERPNASDNSSFGRVLPANSVPASATAIAQTNARVLASQRQKAGTAATGFQAAQAASIPAYNVKPRPLFAAPKIDTALRRSCEQPRGSFNTVNRGPEVEVRRVRSLPDLINFGARPVSMQAKSATHGDALSADRRSGPPLSMRQDGMAIHQGEVLRPNAKGQFRFHDADQPNGVFSNFWEGGKIRIGGTDWPTVEHYFQAAKFDDVQGDSNQVKMDKQVIRNRIRASRTPGETKTAARSTVGGRRVPVDWTDWSDKKRVGVMYEAVFAKFSSNRRLKSLLLATGASNLLETMPDSRKDCFWGVVVDRDGIARGANMLGQVLAQVRNDLCIGRAAPGNKVRFNHLETQEW